MERQLDRQLEALKSLLLSMGGLVEKAIRESTALMNKHSPEGLAQVKSLEDRINQVHTQIDAECLHLLAQQSPVARDLRLIIAVIRMNTDLERMGDQALNIALTCHHYLRGGPAQVRDDILLMSNRVQTMIQNALDTFVTGDTEAAKAVLFTDDEVDLLKDKVFKDLVVSMSREKEEIEGAMNLVLVARNLERLGDHATNIAEGVIFAYTGKDVRHRFENDQEAP